MTDVAKLEGLLARIEKNRRPAPPPLESVLAVDAALKAADVKLAKWIAPPSETNFGGAFLSGALPALEAARDAFVAAIHEVTRGPLAAARRPDRMRR